MNPTSVSKRTSASGASARIGPTTPGVVQLTGVYHNLIRQWAET